MAKAEFRVVGTSPARMGGIDLMLKDQLQGAILRSQYAHAKIISIDTSEASPISDQRSSAENRRWIVEALTRRGLEQTWKAATGKEVV